MKKVVQWVDLEYPSQWKLLEVDLEDKVKLLEVDLEYPSQLHDLHNDYPLAPEKLEITQNMLSKYCSDIADEYRIGRNW